MSTLKRDRSPDDEEVKLNEPPRKKQKYYHSNDNSNTNNNNANVLNRDKLPIDDCADEILSIINNNRIVIITGDTGSGKSTQLSQMLYKSRSNNNISIIITQPRRVGAVSLARRVSKEMNVKLGTLVGYKIRFNDYTTNQTQIKYVTDGILLYELIYNKELTLNKYDYIILDEAHERSLQTDILFTILRDIIINDSINKYKFKLLITSATLNVDKFSLFFNKCPVYHITGRCYPVEVFHCKIEQRDYIQSCIQTAIQIHINPEHNQNPNKLGHILCFLTGKYEIDTACKLMGNTIDALDPDIDSDIPDCVILPCYGALSYNEQQSIFKSVPYNCRKIIFATNIAETSLTINNISFVIDPGLVKQKEFDSDIGIDILKINNISRIAAVQRKGRCGRTMNGKCYRLYTKKELNEFNEETIPEILRNNLCSIILKLKYLGINDVLNGFEYLDKPDYKSIINSLNKLYLLNGIDVNGNITDIGCSMIKFPLNPIYSKILIESIHNKCYNIGLNVVSIISINNNNNNGYNIFLKPNINKSDNDNKMKELYYNKHKQFDSKYGDIISWILVFSEFIKIWKENDDNSNRLYQWTKENYLNYKTLNSALKIYKQIKNIMFKEYDNNKLLKEKQSIKPIKSIRKVLAKSLFMQSAFKINNNNNNNFVFKLYNNINNNLSENIYIHPSYSSILFNKNNNISWIIYLDILYTSKAFMRGICCIKYEWIKYLLKKLNKQQIIINNDNDNLDNKDNNNNDNDGNNDNNVKSNASSLIPSNNKQSIDDIKQRYLRRKNLKKELKSLDI